MKDKFQRIFLLGLFATITMVFFWMVRSFLITLFMAAIFSGIFQPLFKFFEKWTRGRKKLASILTLLVVALAVVGPLIVLVGVVAKQAIEISQSFGPHIQEFLHQSQDVNTLFQRFPRLQRFEPYREIILEKVGFVVGTLGNYIFLSLSSLTSGTVLFFLHVAIMVYAMFFFFTNGSSVLERLMYLIPLQNKDKSRLIKSFVSMARATIKGTAVIGLIQGAGAGLALNFAGIQNSLFWSMLMTVLSMVPTVGTALVWAPACVYLYFKGQVVACISVAIWCALILGSTDNFLKPILIGKDTEMGELMILISTLSGLMMFGLPGVIFGPVIGLLFLTVSDIYGFHFKDVLDSKS